MQKKAVCAAHCLIPYRHSDGAFNLVGTETSCTNVYMARSTLDNRLDALDVGLPHSIGASVGVRDLDAERHTLAANITLCHQLHLQSNGQIPNSDTPTSIGLYDSRFHLKMQEKFTKIQKFFVRAVFPKNRLSFAAPAG
jgi:hypothetical protein